MSQRQTKCLIPWKVKVEVEVPLPLQVETEKVTPLSSCFRFEKLSDGGAVVERHLVNNSEYQ